MDINERFKQMIKDAVTEAKQLPEEIRRAGASLTLAAGRDESSPRDEYTFACADLERSIYVQEQEDGSFVCYSRQEDYTVLPNTNLTLYDAFQISYADNHVEQFIEMLFENRELCSRIQEQLDENRLQTFQSILKAMNELSAPYDETAQKMSAYEKEIQIGMSQTPSPEYGRISNKAFISQCTADLEIVVYITQDSPPYTLPAEVKLEGDFQLEDKEVALTMEYTSIDSAIDTNIKNAETPKQALHQALVAFFGVPVKVIHEVEISTEHLLRLVTNPTTLRALQNEILIDEKSLEAFNASSSNGRRI